MGGDTSAVLLVNKLEQEAVASIAGRAPAAGAVLSRTEQLMLCLTPGAEAALYTVSSCLCVCVWGGWGCRVKLLGLCISSCVGGVNLAVAAAASQRTNYQRSNVCVLRVLSSCCHRQCQALRRCCRQLLTPAWA